MYIVYTTYTIKVKKSRRDPEISQFAGEKEIWLCYLLSV